MDHFKQIATFVQVVQRGSLSAAARHEGVAPALVSRRLDGLEARLGVKLLQRTTRRVTLTPEGASFVENCQRILQELQDAETAVAARGTVATGQIRVTAPAGFGRRFVAPLVASFASLHPRINVVLDLSDRIVDLVAEGIDCAVRFGDQADAALVRTLIGQSHRAVVASPSYLRRHGTPQAIDDLQRHHCLTLAENNSIAQRAWVFQGRSGPSAVRVSGNLTCNDGAVLHAWSLAGLGLAWRSLWEVGEDLTAGRLVQVLDELAAPAIPIYCVMPARKHLPVRVRLFVEHVKAAFAAPELLAALAGEPARKARES
ncbi:MAG TPA: LysR family transcriptional regulator [Burkholderiaceae bacterium]|nr:LysR family transcriptional regulator [Burkholderiaceae bacterium]